MVRFARADGSKGSNKRVLEEPTPWHELTPAQMPESKAEVKETAESVGKGKKKGKAVTDGSVKKGVAKKKKRLLDESGADTLQMKKKKCIAKDEHIDKENDEQVKSDQLTGKANSVEATGVKKTLKKKKLASSNSKANGDAGKKGEIKGKKKRKLDKANGEENSNTVQIKKKKSSADESVNVEKVEIEKVIENEENNNEKSSNVKQKKKKKKAQKNDNGKVEEKKEFVINDKSQRVKVFKDGTERTWFDLPYEEGQRMTRYDNMWVKKEMVDKLEQLKVTLKGEGHSEKEVSKIGFLFSYSFFIC